MKNVLMFGVALGCVAVVTGATCGTGFLIGCLASSAWALRNPDSSESKAREWAKKEWRKG